MLMDVHRFSSSAFNVNSYIIEENGHLLMVDPILTEEIRKAFEKDIVDFAFLTHEHYDHILSVNEINCRNLFPVYCGQAAATDFNNRSAGAMVKSDVRSTEARVDIH